MPADIKAILQLEVPLIVQIAMRTMTLEEVTSLVPGAIIELPKPADDELELVVNNKPIGTGTAVKVGENYGLRVTYIGDLQDRIAAMATNQTETEIMEKRGEPPACRRNRPSPIRTTPPRRRSQSKRDGSLNRTHMAMRGLR